MNGALPILERRAEIESAIRGHRVVVVCGETGSGKTTQLPQICLQMGLATRGMIGHTQPRRLAARAVAARIAEERGERIGGVVGAKVRFQDQTSGATRIKLMTDGVLLAELSSDPELSAYSVIILDEAHERSLNVDFLLGYLKRLLTRRPDLKVIVTSATIDQDRLSAFFGGPAVAPVVEVSGRMYPVEIRYRPAAGDDDDFDRTGVTLVADAVEDLASGPPGDVLVFLPGEREIRLAADAVRRRGVDAHVLPLFSRLTNEEQDRIFHPGASRRVILSTNVAETSLTVPGIRYVIDAGLARISRYDPAKKIQRLPVEPVSRASAHQRSGRCGRIAAGVCVRLYSEESHKARPAFTDPEIRRTSLAGVILRMKAIGLDAIEDFPFLDPPEPAAIRDGYETLFELGAISKPSREGPLTETGRAMSRVPADPRIARMLLGAEREGAIAEVLILAGALSVQDPRMRPAARQDEADRAQSVFRHGASDFITLLRLWDQYRHASETLSHGELAAWCRDHFLSGVRMREWDEMTRQLAGIVGDLGLKKRPSPASEDAIHRAILTGLISNVACREGESGSFEYRGVRANAVHLFPGSVLFRKSPKWIMAAEVVQTTKLYARTVAKIDPEWIEELAGHMFRRQQSDRHFDQDTGEPSAWERVTMSGIVVVPRRRVAMVASDPAGARGVFIREGLVNMKWGTPLDFMTHNKNVVASARSVEAKLRRRNLLLAEEEMAKWFEERLPERVRGPESFEAWRTSGADQEVNSLRLSLADVLRPEAAPGADRLLYPDSITLGGDECALRYALAPGREDDGVTVDVPLLTLASLTPAHASWLVPGMVPELVQGLIRSLPKGARAAIEARGPLEVLGSACAEVMRFAEGHIADALSEAVGVLHGIDIAPAAWSLKSLPTHLRLRVRVLDSAGRELGADRDVAALHARLAPRIAKARSAGARAAFERRGLRAWTFGELPERVSTERDGTIVDAYPAVVDEGGSVAITLLESPRTAAALTALGLRRLFAIACEDEVVHSLASLPGWKDMTRQYGAVGDPDHLGRDLSCVIAERVFLTGQPPVRTGAAFEERSREMWGRLGQATREAGEMFARVLEARDRVARRLSGGTPRLWAESVADMREHAAFLMARGFVRVLPWERLKAYPTYAEALRDRLLSLREDGSGVEKDALRGLVPRWKRFTAWVAAAMAEDRVARVESEGGAPRPRPGKGPLPQARRAAPVVNLDAGEWAMRPGAMPPEVERYRWALEDWRATLFSPKPARATPTSGAELDAMWSKVTAAGDGPRR